MKFFSNKPSWSGFLGKDGLHPYKSGDLRLANYFCRFLKKCVSSDNASRKRKNCQSITPEYILDPLEFPPLPFCNQPSFLSSWPQHSGSALPCSELPTSVDPVPMFLLFHQLLKRVKNVSQLLLNSFWI
ncbi:uncharacterized protein LOC129958799 isoform X2 [Argiope bruennichi]|uniref:uncharacterized protein LOC129958799 isoform X2 n=1 Tax=Argiope bruennichi TaxID=94029 RepID=UPI002494830D|nr:uncharacterized protein LOC129958799 isoform X2 [Argiope bruennichi]XP_055927458.1 uncharacterized protein LOC129958799 isoform X2 [Argiope bruennichi]